MAPLYDTDFTQWAERTAKLLRDGHFAEIEMAALIEEIEGLARSDRKAIYRQLRRLLFHLLKLAYFSDRHYQRAGAGWKRTVINARHEIEESIRDSPSLVSYPATRLAEAYDNVRREASVLPHFPENATPRKCPWSIEQVLDPTFFPSRQHG
jgi:Domain of unknown function DUF29